MRIRLLAAEWVALRFLLALLLFAFFDLELARALWIGSPVLQGFVWLLAILVAVVFASPERRDREDPSWKPLRRKAALPLALAGALLMGSTVSHAGSIVLANRHLDRHEAEMATARRSAPEGAPAAIPYYDGVPDGGVAIVYGPSGDPAVHATAAANRAVNGQVSRCSVLRRDHWLCFYG